MFSLCFALTALASCILLFHFCPENGSSHTWHCCYETVWNPFGMIPKTQRTLSCIPQLLLRNMCANFRVNYALIFPSTPRRRFVAFVILGIFSLGRLLGIFIINGTYKSSFECNNICISLFWYHSARVEFYFTVMRTFLHWFPSESFRWKIASQQNSMSAMHNSLEFATEI